MKILSILTLLVCTIMVTSVAGDFHAFLAKHKKSYSASEKKKRETIYAKNIAKIKKKNQEAAKRKHNLVYAENRFADMSPEEIRAKYMGLILLPGVEGRRMATTKKTTKPTKTKTTKTTKTKTTKTTKTKTTKTTTKKTATTKTTTKTTTTTTTSTQDPSQFFDWSAQLGMVSEVRDQGGCGSCWAFATTALVETYWARKGHGLTSFSEQMLVDCEKNSKGCGGGYLSKALLWEQINGTMSRDVYPYVAKDQNCAFNPSSVVTKIGSYAFTYSEDDIHSFLRDNGPFLIGIAADNLDFYSKGILTAEDCKLPDINHAVVIVGYGYADGYNYWKIRNSWGTGWGEGGYLRLERGKNACKIVTEKAYYIIS